MRSRFVFGGVVSVLIAAVLALVVFAISVFTPAATASGDLTTQDLSAVTAQDLASALVGGGVAISNVTFTGAPDSAGSFTGGTGIIGTVTPGSGGIDSGVILSSGNVAGVVGPNTSDATSASNEMPGDTDLAALARAGSFTFDAVVLEFDFVPDADQVFFQYVFGSEEYNEWVNTPFNDVFGFFVNEVNCATVPGSEAPEPVTVNVINNGNHPELYINNDLASGAPFNTELDGLTHTLTCEASVVMSQTNHIKLAIADTGDHVLDSDVFIAAGSLSTSPPPTPSPTPSPVQCGNSGPVFQDDSATTYNLNPDTGYPNDAFTAHLSGLNEGGHHVEVLWDANMPDGPYGQKVGDDNIGSGGDVAAAVPSDATPGEHQVTVCWSDIESYFYQTLTYTVGAPTPTPPAETTSRPTGAPEETPTSTATPTATPSPTPSPVPTPSPDIVTEPPTPPPTPSPSPTPTATPSPTPSLAPIPLPVIVTEPPTQPPTPSPSPTPTPTPTPSPTPSPTLEPTLIPPASATPAPTFSPAPTRPPTGTPAPTAVPTTAPTASPGPTFGPPTEAPATPTPTPVAISAAATVVSGFRGIPTPTPVRSATPTPTPRPTATLSPSPSPAPTVLSASRAPQDTPEPGSIITDTGGNGGVPEFAQSVLSPGGLSTDPAVIGINAALAGFTLLLLVMTSELFNKTVEENHDTLSRWLKPVFGPIESFFRFIGDSWKSTTGESAFGMIGGPLAVLALSGLIYGALEPGFGFNNKSIVMFLSIIITVGIITYFYNGGQIIVSKRLFSTDGAIRLFPLGVLFAALCVLLSRIDGFQPGIIYGFIASAVLFSETEPNEEQNGKIIFYPVLALLGLCVLAWFLISPLGDFANNHGGWWAALPETIAVGVFVGGLEGTFFQMIPLRYLDGHKIWSWNKLAWVLVAGGAAFLFWDALLRDQSSSMSTVSHGTPAAAIVAMVIFFVLSVGFYAFFRLRGPEEALETVEA